MRSVPPDFGDHGNSTHRAHGTCCRSCGSAWPGDGRRGCPHRDKPYDADCRLQVAGCRLQVAGCRLQAAFSSTWALYSVPCPAIALLYALRLLPSALAPPRSLPGLVWSAANNKVGNRNWPGATPNGGKRELEGKHPLASLPLARTTHSRMTSDPESHQTRVNHHAWTGCPAG